MIEALIAAVIGIVEAILAVLAAVIEWVAGFFIAGGEALGAGEIVLIALIFCLELVVWLVLVVAELLTALIKWRRPRRVARPTIWRPNKMRRNNERKLSAHPDRTEPRAGSR